MPVGKRSGKDRGGNTAAISVSTICGLMVGAQAQSNSKSVSCRGWRPQLADSRVSGGIFGFFGGSRGHFGSVRHTSFQGSSRIGKGEHFDERLDRSIQYESPVDEEIQAALSYTQGSVAGGVGASALSSPIFTGDTRTTAAPRQP
ncbi:MAG: hypothetical protein JWP38_2979 [Herbaspirillum sp.]|nr:hypothetical protein [Herbaspirillum sp.]